MAFPLFAALVTGCASTPLTRGLVEDRPAGLPARADLESVPFFPQERYQCGPAALATVLTHAGMPTEPDALVTEVYLPERGGTLRTELRAATRARGLVPYPLTQSLEALLREVAAGRPVLVMQNLGFDWFSQWHFAVVVGYDLERAEITLHSGTKRRLTRSMRVFERTWARSGHWAQVVVPPDEIPVGATPLTWLESVHELERNRPAAAALGYRAAVARWPDSHEAWMAHGNAAHARNEMEQSREAFIRAIKIAPERYPAWNNLAYALAATGCHKAGRRAARCAITLAPDEPGPRDTLEEIKAMSETNDGAACGLPACPVPE